MATARPLLDEATIRHAVACYHDPMLWAETYIDNCGVTYQGASCTADQQRLARAVAVHPRVAAPSGQGVGKTHVAALILLWWMLTRSPAICVTTGSSQEVVRGVLWDEVRKLVHRLRIPLPGTILKRAPEWRISYDHFARGLSVSDLNNISGRHSPNLLVIVEEAEGVKADIWIALYGLCASEGSKILAIGNPFEAIGPFYEISKSPIWTTMHLSCMNHPNVVTGRNIFPGMTSREWVEAMKKEWGEDSPMYGARVLGQYPDAGLNTLIPRHLIDRAFDQPPFPRPPDEVPVIGCDIADQGDDDTAVVAFHGPNLIYHQRWHGWDEVKTRIELERIYRSMETRMDSTPAIVIDRGNTGAAVIAELRDRGIDAFSFPFGRSLEHQENLDEYQTLGAEAWFLFRRSLDHHAVSLWLQPKDQPKWEGRELRDELHSRNYVTNDAGQVQLEKKMKMKSRGIASPDAADAIVMAWWYRMRRLGSPLDLGVSSGETQSWRRQYAAMTGSRFDGIGQRERMFDSFLR